MKHKTTSPEKTRCLIEAADWGFSPNFKAEAEAEVIEESTETSEVAEEEEIVESTEEEIHVCPLCECRLEEELPDEILAEHINDILEIAASEDTEELNESEDDE